MFYESEAEKAKHAETEAKVTAEFKAEFAAMMRKYKCEMGVATSSRNYETSVDGVEFDFDGIYEDGETVRPYFSVNVGTFFDKDSK